jgi:hypothetical protein
MRLCELTRLLLSSLPQPCGGAIPLCMVDEFDIPAEIIDRKVCERKEGWSVEEGARTRRSAPARARAVAASGRGGPRSG